MEATEVTYADIDICRERLAEILKELKEVLKMINELDKREKAYILTLPEDERHGHREWETLISMRFDVKSVIKKLNKLVLEQPDRSPGSWWQFWK